MPFLKVVDGSVNGRDVLTPMHDEKTLIFQKHSSLAPADAGACGARELSRSRLPTCLF